MRTLLYVFEMYRFDLLYGYNGLIYSLCSCLAVTVSVPLILCMSMTLYLCLFTTTVIGECVLLPDVLVCP